MPNLVYFGSPSIALSNGKRTISIYDQIVLIFFNLEVTPILKNKRIGFPPSKLILCYCMFDIQAQ